VAREVIEKLVDDIDGTEAVETVPFAIDGESYEIDLSKRNAAGLRKALDPYIRAGRRNSRATAGRRRPMASTRRGTTTQRAYDLAQLREWAGANRVEVPSRGRIPQAVVDQYKAAGGR
jgi:hypothetical protein